MATNANELRAAAEQYRELSADIADAMDGFCSQTELISLLSRLADITRPMQRHILATVPADDRPHCPYTLVPMTINADGRGPEMDPAKVVRTEWQVWDELNRCVAVVPPEDDGEPVTVEKLRQQLADVTAERDRLRDELVMSDARRELVQAAYDRAIKIVEVGPHAATKREAKELSDSARTLQELQGTVNRLHAELMQTQLDAAWIIDRLGGFAERYEGDYMEWPEKRIAYCPSTKQAFRTNEHGSYLPGPLETRAAVLEAVAETNGADDGN